MLARAAAPGASVVAIDPHAGSDRGPQEIGADSRPRRRRPRRVPANLAAAGVAERVRHVRKMSADALGDVEGPLALLYVDGAHRFGPARDDVARWGARVAPGGTMLVHDSFSSIGVTGALLAECVARGGWRYAGRTGSLAEYERLAAPAARPRARARRRAPARPAPLVRPQRALQAARHRAPAPGRAPPRPPGRDALALLTGVRPQAQLNEV